MEWFEILIDILPGLITVIPLVIGLIKYVKKSVQEKNWGSLLTLVVKCMKEAEGKFDNGADRKQWVLSVIEASADTIECEVDMKKVDSLIDSLCEMSKVVNTKEVSK